MTRSDLLRHFPTLIGIGPRLRSLHLPRIRHKMRWAAVAVLAVGLAIGWKALRQYLDSISKIYCLRAEAYVRLAYEASRDADALAARLDATSGSDDAATFYAYVKVVRRRSYFRRLTVKYYLAANRPWMTVEPDPPPPE